jgi:hypothetical protein
MVFPYSLHDLPQTHTDKHRPKIIKIASINSLGSFMSSRLMAEGSGLKAQSKMKDQCSAKPHALTAPSQIKKETQNKRISNVE